MRLAAFFKPKNPLEDLLKDAPDNPVAYQAVELIRACASLCPRAGAGFALDGAMVCRWRTDYQRSHWTKAADVSHRYFNETIEFLDRVMPQIADLAEVESPGSLRRRPLPPEIPADGTQAALGPLQGRIQIVRAPATKVVYPTIPECYRATPYPEPNL